MQNRELIDAIGVLTQIVQPKDNKISFTTQNKAQAILVILIQELAERAGCIVEDINE